jgi:hypothetical protein
MAKKLTMQQKSERGRSEKRQIGQKQRKDRKEEAAIARANAMLDDYDEIWNHQRYSKSK